MTEADHDALNEVWREIVQLANVLDLVQRGMEGTESEAVAACAALARYTSDKLDPIIKRTDPRHAAAATLAPN